MQFCRLGVREDCSVSATGSQVGERGELEFLVNELGYDSNLAIALAPGWL